MSKLADSAVGAILEIPPAALDSIEKAEKAIEKLAVTSLNAANSVRDHWGKIATDGLDEFIRKVREATGVMENIKGAKIDLTVNTNNAERQIDSTSRQIQNDLERVSATVQQIAQSFNFDNAEQSFKSFYSTIGEAEQGLRRFQEARNKMEVNDPEIDRYNRIIELLKEYIATKKKSEETITKITRKDADTENLNEQKILLQQIAQLRKDIISMGVAQQREERLGKQIPQEDVDRLNEYIARLSALTEAYNNLKLKINEMSEAGQRKFNAADIKEELSATREQEAAQTKLNQALQNTAKLTSQTKLKSAGISSREESIYQNELVAVYQQMIKLIKMKGDMEAQIAAQGYAQTAAQTNYLQQLKTEYERLENSLANVTGKYTEIDRAVKASFENTKTIQEAENAAKLADAYQKAAEAADKKNKAEAKTEQTDLSKDRAEYKRILTLIEQIEKAQRKVNEALASATLPANLAQQLQSAQTAAETTLNNLYNRRAELEAKRGQELNDIAQQNEVKKGAAAIAEHERAEKEKTRISRQAATDRYNEEMRQARLQNQALTAQGKQQRISINDAKEQRAIELAQERQREVERLRQEITRLDKQDVNYQKNLDRLNQRINELLGATTQHREYTKEEALALAKNAKTLRECETAYKALKDAMAKADPNSKDWAAMNAQLQKTKTSIDDIKRKMGELNSSTKTTSGLLKQLQGRIAAAFSVVAINNFIKKVVETRAQFELQRVALGAILQDRDEANKVFVQIQNMALQSPFSIMQLERATKQIAAFGFEGQKLLPTMKMFADISAGLGVELERITLVMGHLKARGFLEGTMVRQFTNMGFNVLGNLAKYYSELEGKMVSVGEVQDRVKKKMISFGDVEEVLKRVTSAGGMFYDMQKKQSDSIWGQMQRITDAYDLMLNSIGQANEGSIKDALTTIRALISNWRTVAKVMQTVVGIGGGLLLIFKSINISARSSAVLKWVESIYVGLKNAVVQAGGLKAALMSLNATGWGAILAGVAMIGYSIYNLTQQTSALRDELKRVGSESMVDMYDSIYQFKELAKVVTDANKPYAEREEALGTLKRTYRDILPAEMLEIENIRKMADGYNEVTEAIRAYYTEAAKKKAEEAIATNTEQAWATIIEHAKDWADVLQKGQDDLRDLPLGTLKGLIGKTMRELKQEIDDGTTKVDDAWERFKILFKETSGRSIEDNFSTRGFKAVFGKYTFTVADFYDDITDVVKRGNEAQAEFDAEFAEGFSAHTKLMIQEYNKRKQLVSDFYNALQKYANLQQNNELYDNNGQLTEMGRAASKELTTATAKINQQFDFVGEARLDWDKLAEATQNNTDVLLLFDDVQQRVLGGYLSDVREIATDNSLKAWAERTERDLSQVGLSDMQKDIISLAKESAKANGISMTMLDKLRISAETNYASAANAAHKLAQSAEEDVKRIAATRAELFALGRTAEQAQKEAEAKHGAGYTESELKELAIFWDNLAKLYGYTEKQKSAKVGDSELKRWQDLKKAIDDVKTSYEKYRQTYDAAESNRRIEKEYGPLFKELGADIKDFYKNGKYDAEELIKALGVLKGMVNETTEARKKFAHDLSREQTKTQVEIDVKVAEESIENFKKEVDKMFDNYELTKELKNMGVNIDLTYMVGGKPTTLQDIRNEIARLRQEGGGAEDAKKRIKVLEDAEKRLTQIELKEQQQRLKNYQKYLTKMYSDRGKTMIESYATMQQMEADFQKNIQQLQLELNAPDTTDARKKELASLISTLQNQAAEAAVGIKRELSEALAKADWNDFKGSEIFESMYHDLDTLGKKGIDALITRLEAVRDKLQSVADIDPKAVREVTQYIEKLKTAKVELAPYAAFKESIAAAKELKKEYGSLEDAQVKLAELNDKVNADKQQVADLETIIGLQEKGLEVIGEDEETTARLKALQKEYGDNLQDALNTARDTLKTDQADADALNKKVAKAKQVGAAYKSQMAVMDKYKEYVKSITDSIFEMADALGGTVDDEWKNLASSIIEATFQAITLQLQFQMLGVAMNSALGIIGWVATALQVVASLLTAIFAAKDKRLQKKIENIQEQVDRLSKSFDNLQNSIERAFNISTENRLTEQALDNLEQQKRQYEEMIRLEESKKKTDKDKIKEYKDKIEELAEAEEELWEKRHEKYGSTNSSWDEANNWVDAWLDVFKQAGDGLSSLNDSWDEFYENLVKKQATSAILGNRMQDYINQINGVIDSNMDEYGYVDAFKTIGEKFKSEFGDLNQKLIDFFNYAGIGTNGSLILSDLQKGIQNITEPQAAAIEAYLNSMRFAVFQHTEQLDTLITTIQAQYGNGTENPIVTELKGIRGVLDNIYTTLRSVVKVGMGKTYIQVG